MPNISTGDHKRALEKRMILERMIIDVTYLIADAKSVISSTEILLVATKKLLKKEYDAIEVQKLYCITDPPIESPPSLETDANL